MHICWILYIFLQPHSHAIIIRRDVKFDENILAWESNLEFVTSISCEPNSVLVPSSTPNFLDRFPTIVYDDDSEDENLPPPAHFPLVSPAQPLPRWVRSTCAVVGDLVGDPRDPRQTHSHFQQASSLLAQVSKNHDP